MLSRVEKLQRVVFLLVFILAGVVVSMDLFVWRP